MTDRRVKVNNVYTVTGVDAQGNWVSESVSVPTDEIIYTQTNFKYVGPRWWCYYMLTRDRVRSLVKHLTGR